MIQLIRYSTITAALLSSNSSSVLEMAPSPAPVEVVASESCISPPFRQAHAKNRVLNHQRSARPKAPMSLLALFLSPHLTFLINRPDSPFKRSSNEHVSERPPAASAVVIPAYDPSRPTGTGRCNCASGWFNLLGQFAMTMGIWFVIASLIQRRRKRKNFKLASLFRAATRIPSHGPSLRGLHVIHMLASLGRALPSAARPMQTFDPSTMQHNRRTEYLPRLLDFLKLGESLMNTALGPWSLDTHNQRHDDMGRAYREHIFK